jgi:predicted nucleic acid-binding protein
MLILDSDVLIEILRKGSHRGAEALETLKALDDDIVTTAINIHEVLYGLVKRGKHLPDLMRMRALPYTREDASLSANLEIHAEQAGTPSGRTDTMIAAVAINNNAKLYTFNRSHFQSFTGKGLILV